MLPTCNTCLGTHVKPDMIAELWNPVSTYGNLVSRDRPTSSAEPSRDSVSRLGGEDYLQGCPPAFTYMSQHLRACAHTQEHKEKLPLKQKAGKRKAEGNADGQKHTAATGVLQTHHGVVLLQCSPIEQTNKTLKLKYTPRSTPVLSLAPLGSLRLSAPQRNVLGCLQASSSLNISDRVGPALFRPLEAGQSSATFPWAGCLSALSLRLKD